MADEKQLATTNARAGVIHLEVVTPTGRAVSTDVDQVEAPSVQGEFGVLPGHLPLLAALKSGVVRYRRAGKSFALAVGPGFAEAGADVMSILTDRCVDAADVVVADARKALDEATRKLDAYTGPVDSAEHEELARAVDWFQAQVDAVAEVGRA